jgi:hypothetical protein
MTTVPRQIMIDPLSAQSLLIEVSVNGHVLSTATGFIIRRDDTDFLITNWHVVTGRDSETEQPLSPTAAVPDTIRIVLHAKAKLGAWVIGTEPLYINGQRAWLEHSKGRLVDVVALPLKNIPAEAAVYPLDLALAGVDLQPQPAMPVSIIGYPFGISAGGAWPIWKTGHIATDPDIDYDGRPAFLIDATTRGGMSGSPVVVRISGGYNDSKGNYILAGGVVTKFLGIYSGRVHEQAEIGRVWRPGVLSDILGG